MPASIVVGVSGSIAAYKTVDLCRRLIEAGFEVSVAMTENACRFVSPLTFHAVTGREVYCSLWDKPFAHIELAKADRILVAPASANIIAKAANGIADGPLSTLLLAAGSAVSFTPAMNWRMYENPVLQGHIQKLLERDCGIIEPESGDLACGEEGRGRLAGTEEILAHVERVLGPGDFRNKRVLVTCGPTREPIDPVRFISNRSSGTMGAAMALEAYRRGATVTVISGPITKFFPREINRIRVETASQMREAVMNEVVDTDLAIMVAAVSDYAPVAPHREKGPKRQELFSLDIAPTPDILQELGSLREKPFLVGFSAETGPVPERALDKLKRKAADLMVFNDVTEEGAGFETDTNVVSIIEPSGDITPLPLMSKRKVAEAVFDRITVLSGNGKTT